MFEPPLRILLIEDNPAEARLLKETLGEMPGRFELAHAQTLAGALATLAAGRFDAILLDLSLPDSQGLDTIRAANAAAPEVPILVLTGMDNEKLSLDAIRHGAQDYLVKGQVDARLTARAIHYARERKRLEAERKRAEEALRLSEQRFRHAADNLPDLFLIYDARRRIQFVNSVGLALFGLAPDALVGRRDEEVWPPELTSQYLPLLDEAIATRKIVRGELSLSLAGSSRREMVVAYVPILDREGRVDQVLAMTHDVTGHKAAQRAREDADRRKDAFLANISHELRTPMNAILGMTELAMDEPISATVRDYLQTAKSSADVLLALLNELLDYSRIQAGKFMLESVPFGLRAAVAVTVRTFAVPAQEKGLELVCDLPPGVPDRLIGDPLRLRQVLMNLLGNAIKFTPHGEIVLRVRLVGETPGEVQLEFAVADTGIGISDEDQRKIFSPFTQVDASTTRRYGGTGLGLSIAASLAGLMGGRLCVQSALGQGSTFSLTARFARPLGPDSAGRLTNDRLRGVRLLVVEPNRSSRAALEPVLREWQMEPTLVADLPAALDLARQAAARGTPFPAVLVEGSLAAPAEITAAPWNAGDPACRPRLIVMVRASARQQSSFAAAGEIICLEKPVLAGELLSAIGKALGRPLERVEGASTGSAGARPSRPLRILLAEDTMANQKVVAAVLGRRGHTVDLAADGQQALELLGAGDYDLVLMDVQMPVMDGFQATAAIRALGEPAASLPIVALTAHAMRGDAERCLAAGMDAYIAKPIDAGELVELVERLAVPR